jgi:hypothetical protein
MNCPHCLWDLATRHPVGEPLKEHTNRVSTVVFSPDGKMLTSASDDTCAAVGRGSQILDLSSLLHRESQPLIRWQEYIGSNIPYLRRALSCRPAKVRQVPEGCHDKSVSYSLSDGLGSGGVFGATGRSARSSGFNRETSGYL